MDVVKSHWHIMFAKHAEIPSSNATFLDLVESREIKDRVSLEELLGYLRVQEVAQQEEEKTLDMQYEELYEEIVGCTHQLVDAGVVFAKELTALQDEYPMWGELKKSQKKKRMSTFQHQLLEARNKLAHHQRGEYEGLPGSTADTSAFQVNMQAGAPP